MTRKEALAELIAKVEAGGLVQPFLFQDVFNNQFTHENCAGEALSAYDGSLDAAKALHEAVLPEWDWVITPDGASVYSPHDNSPTDGDLDNPARAWLLAILRALHGMEPDA